MDINFNNNRGDSSNANMASNHNNHVNNNNWCNSCNTTKKGPSGLPKSCKKSTSIGFSHDTAKAVVAEEVGLDHISSQLQKL